MIKFQYIVAFLVAISSLNATDPIFTINYLKITNNIAVENFDAAGELDFALLRYLQTFYFDQRHLSYPEKKTSNTGPSKTTPNLCNQDDAFRKYACEFVMETMEKIGKWTPNRSPILRKMKLYTPYRLPVRHTGNKAFAIPCTKDQSFQISDEYFNSVNASSSSAGSARKPTFRGIFAISEGSTYQRMFVYVITDHNYKDMSAVLQIDTIDYRTHVSLQLVAKKLEVIASKSEENDGDDE